MRHLCPCCGQEMPGNARAGEPAVVERAPRPKLDCQRERPVIAPVARVVQAVPPPMPAPTPISEQIVPRCTDHALLRYLERAKGLDVEACRREIMTHKIKFAIRAGAVGVIVNGHRMKVSKDGAIVTVLDREMSKPKPSAKFRHRLNKPKPEIDEIREYFRDWAEQVLA